MNPLGLELERLPAGLALIALGANLGSRAETLDAALAALEELPGNRVVARSSWHVTAPVGGPAGQGDFLNGVALLSTDLAPEALLELLHAVEARFGRERHLHHGPRTLDLDLLLHGDEVRGGPGLELPHPRMHERTFVLAPLAELCPALTLAAAGGATVAKQLAALSAAPPS